MTTASPRCSHLVLLRTTRSTSHFANKIQTSLEGEFPDENRDFFFQSMLSILSASPSKDAFEGYWTPGAVASSGVRDHQHIPAPNVFQTFRPPAWGISPSFMAPRVSRKPSTLSTSAAMFFRSARRPARGPRLDAPLRRQVWVALEGLWGGEAGNEGWGNVYEAREGLQRTGRGVTLHRPVFAP